MSRSSQELSEIGTLCHLTKPAWTHLKLLKLQSVSNKPPRLLLSFNLFLTYPDARLPLMHSTYLNHCMIFETTKEAVNWQKQKQKHVSQSDWLDVTSLRYTDKVWSEFEVKFDNKHNLKLSLFLMLHFKRLFPSFSNTHLLRWPLKYIVKFDLGRIIIYSTSEICVT